MRSASATGTGSVPIGVRWFRGFLCLLVCLAATSRLWAADRYGSHTAAEFAKHVRELKKKLPSDDFTIVVSPPFVVIGDDEPAEVRRRAKETVQWAVEKLKAAYFPKDPVDILDIWLFKDKESYEENVEKLFHSKPDTPYGYFSESDKALVMNIATGGGTLVHEIVHPFVAANFPECPAWFNEGLGSLYEQSDERTAESSATPIGVCPACSRRFARSGCRRLRRSARPRPTSSMRRTGARITPRPDTCSIICSSRGYCGSTITASMRTARKTRPATPRSRKSSAERTWPGFSGSGRPTC